ncbi:MAG: hypothetical protein FJ384_06210 [Verrucomicrobia bacterium]|nr:hypothetical protein [Verrucomicrobiota bacterium]
MRRPLRRSSRSSAPPRRKARWTPCPRSSRPRRRLPAARTDASPCRRSRCPTRPAGPMPTGSGTKA